MNDEEKMQFGLFRRWSPYARAYDAIMAEARELAKLNERARQDQHVRTVAAREAASEVQP